MDQGTVWILVYRGRWTLGMKETPALLVSTSSPAWPLCSRAISEEFHWKWHFNGGFFALGFCLVGFFLYKSLHSKKETPAIQRVWKCVHFLVIFFYPQLQAAFPLQPDQWRARPRQGSQKDAGIPRPWSCWELFWQDISMSIVHPQCQRAAFNKNFNGRTETSLAEPLLLQALFHRQVQVSGETLEKFSECFFSCFSSGFCTTLLSIKINRAVGSYFFTLQRTSLHFNLI